MPFFSNRLIACCISILTVFTACQTRPSPSRLNTQPETPVPPVFNPGRLPTQTFSINPLRDTLIKTSSGARIFIPKNSFTDSAGKTASAPVDLEWKEALQPADIILAGLATTTNGAILQTGGMVFINARREGSPLQLVPGREISISIPAPKKDSRMKIFEGKSDSLGINWINPRPLVQARPPQKPVDNPWSADSSGKPERKMNEAVPGEEAVMEADFIMDDTLSDGELERPGLNRRPPPAVKGYNVFDSDPATQYVFVLKKLGWANIDVLFDDPRLNEVNLFTQIEAQAEFSKIYITLVLPRKNIYLPGYQKKDNSFAFTHGDFEKTELPIGEPAIVIATAYKGKETFFAAKDFTVTASETVNLSLAPVMAEELKTRVSSLF